MHLVCIEAHIKLPITSCSGYLFGSPKESCFNIIRNTSLSTQGSNDVSKPIYSQICGPETYFAKGIPADISQLAHYLCHTLYETWLCSLPSCLLLCLCTKLGHLGPQSTVYNDNVMRSQELMVSPPTIH